MLFGCSYEHENIIMHGNLYGKKVITNIFQHSFDKDKLPVLPLNNIS